jgi:phospholipid/cholesterol/gamma-HCH transport system substrate-binding protein
MTKPFKFRYVNEIAGAFVLLVAGLFIVGVILTGRAQGWFERHRTVFIIFPVEGSSGLQEGAGVEMLGTTAGTVERIQVEADGRMRAALSIREDFYRYVRIDSKVILRKTFVVAGDAYVEITRGQGEEPPDDHVFSCEIGRELITTIQEIADELRESRLAESILTTIDEVRESMIAVLDRAEETLAAHAALAEDLGDAEDGLPQLVARLDRITARLEAGEGAAGMVLSDPAFAENLGAVAALSEESLREIGSILKNVQEATAKLPELTETMELTRDVLKDVKALTAGLPDTERLDEFMKTLQAILQDIQKATALLPSLAETMGEEVRDIPGTVLQIRKSLQEAEKLLVAVQKHWLIRGYVEEPERHGRIPPSRVAPLDAAGGRTEPPEQPGTGGEGGGER